MNIYDFTLTELEEYLVKNGFKKYNATQIIEWIYEKKVYDFNKMTNLSKKLISFLNENLVFENLEVIEVEKSTLANKYLLRLKDNNKIECVLMNHDYGYSLCVSSQVGCNMGCSFCSSGILGKQRDLKPHEMVGEVLIIDKLLKEEGRGERVSHIVIMGTGEPFDNYDNVMDFIRIVNNQKGLAIGARHITVSTCGIPDKIKKYSLEGLQTNLAISLHAPNDELRNRLMKINKAHPLDEVMEAVREYETNAGRRVTYEYLLLEGINDTKECALELIDLIKGTFGYVNLIPYNETNKNDYKRSSGNRVHAFLDILMKNGVKATIRKEFGSDIDAACGQLKAKVGD